jgi:hypothetical protein
MVSPWLIIRLSTFSMSARTEAPSPPPLIFFSANLLSRFLEILPADLPRVS